MPRIKAVFAFLKNPLQHLSRYFHTGNGKDLKYAKQARQTIAFIQNGKSQIGVFFGTVLEFLFNKTPMVLGLIAKLFKVTLITITTIIGYSSIYASLWYRKAIGQHLEMPVYIQWIVFLIFSHTINRLISIIQAEIWYGYHSKGVVEDNYQINCILFGMSSVILFFLYAITTSL